MFIRSLEVHPLDVSLETPFGIAGGSQHRAENLLVEVTLDDGTSGLGEAAPFPAANGETRERARHDLNGAREVVVGSDPRRWRQLSEALRDRRLSGSARAAFEVAVLDAASRRVGLSLWHFFGAREPALTTDVTIVTGSVDEARAAALRWTQEGFLELKVKVGGAPLEHDVARLRAVAAAAPHATLLIDGNASRSAEETLELLDALGESRRKVRLLEQPCRKDDHAGHRRLREAGWRVALDESASGPEDLAALLAERAVDVVNVKVMKAGLVAALDLAIAARSAGLGLMIGGMVETELTMSASACLAAGLGGLEAVDLDTPRFLLDSPLRGAWRSWGPRRDVSALDRGHGVTRRETAPTHGGGDGR